MEHRIDETFNIRSDGQQKFRDFRGLYQILGLVPKVGSGIVS